MPTARRWASALALPSIALLACACGFDAEQPLPGDDLPGHGNGDSPPSPTPEPAHCEGKSEQPTEAVWTISSGGLERELRVRVPADYDPTVPIPLVLNFHGYGSYAAQQDWLSGLGDRVDDRHFVAVHANGTGTLKSWNAGACCGSAAENQIDDLQFVIDMLDELEAELCIDGTRIYSTGMSNGGFLSHRLACELSDRIAAIAPVAGVIGVEDCAPSRPMPVMHFHGTSDLLVPIEGNAALHMPSVRETMTGWALRNGCSSDAVETFANGDGTCYAYQGCDADSEVITCIVDGGGHTWPGGQPLPMFGKTSDDISATDELLDFFTRHSLQP